MACVFTENKEVGPVAVPRDEGPKVHVAQKDATMNDESQHVKKSPSATPTFKKRHKGCSYCILDIENNPVPEFPSNEVVVGVITMEDVIEELLKVRLLCFA